jgi:peptidoglycan-N-acetylglucosamine deacetylase
LDAQHGIPSKVQILARLLLIVATAGCTSPVTHGGSRVTELAPVPMTPSENASEVAVTVDDLPIHGPPTSGIDRAAIAERFLSAFDRHGLRAVYGFVNGKRIAEEPSSESILRLWRERGHALGNHTYSHVSLNAVDLSAYFEDLEKGEEILRKVEPDAGVWRVFRYPFLYEGDTPEKRDGVRRYLREHRYLKAEVSIDADDWAFNAPFSRCTAQNDAPSLAKLRRIFVEVHVDELRRMRELSRAIMHREVRHVLLLHIGVADADVIEDLLVAYEKQHVKWIDLRTALADPFYGLDSGPPARYGAAFPYRLAKARAMDALPAIFERDLEDELARVCPIN